MSKTFNNFGSKEEKETLIFNKYLDILSSDLSSCPTRVSYDSDKYSSFDLCRKKVTTVNYTIIDCQSIVTISKTRSGISVMFNTYNGPEANRIFSFSMSIYPYSVKTIEDIENYGRYKMLKKFIKSKDEIMDNIYEGLRLFNIRTPYGRTARIVSTRVCYYSYPNGYRHRVGINFPLLSLNKNHPITIDGAFRSHISKDDLASIKTKFDRDDVIKANRQDKKQIDQALLANL